MGYDYAIHSDYLIHWTGKDIDLVHDPNWYDEDKSKTTSLVTDLYLARLRDILRFGLWMTEAPAWTVGVHTAPPTPICCFTELKVSESRRHARHYGRLGVGVKRPFLIDRLGRPLAYYGYSEEIRASDPFLEGCARDLSEKGLLHFFKPMNRSARMLNYDLYSESEWRIVLLEQLLRKGLVVDPRDTKNVAHHAYFESLCKEEQNKLQYLIPLDGWFQFLIYPSLEKKNEAQKNLARSIRDEILRIKTRPGDHANNVEGGNWPIETNLDACRNF